jgi:uncharacterized protein YyaL (SSP411 family)
LTAPNGGFYSSLDADSEGEEGAFYRWSAEQLSPFRNREGFSDFASAYRLEGDPNFEGKFFVPDPGSTLTVLAERGSTGLSDLLDGFREDRQAMLSEREKRARPLTDAKILTGWNGLMITGLADAGRILKRKDYTSAALKATGFLLKNSRQQDGRLLRSYAKGEAKLNGYLDDYAFLTAGLLALHRSLGDERLLGLAAEITDQQIESFWDLSAGGFFFTSADHPDLIVRLKDPVDSALPSGISVTAENLFYLTQHGVDHGYGQHLQATLQSLTPLMRRSPAAAPGAAAVMAAFLETPPEP